MGFGKKKTNKSKKSGFSKGKSKKGKSPFRRTGNIWNTVEDSDRFFFASDDFHGSLIFIDGKTEKAYQIKYMSLFTPKKNKDQDELPENLQFNVVVNIENEDSVEEIDLSSLVGE